MNRILYFDNVNQAREYLKRESHPFPVAFLTENGTVSVHTFSTANSRSSAEDWVRQNMREMGVHGQIVEIEGEEE